MSGEEELSGDTLDPETASELGSDTSRDVVVDAGGDDPRESGSAPETGAVTENRL